MKKLKMVMAIAFALVLFSGCKKQTQTEFSEELAKQGEMNAGEYSAVIDKVVIEANEGEEPDASTRTMLDMASKMIGGTKVSGDYLVDFEKERLAMNMTVDGLGQKLPVEFFYDGKRPSVYFSTEFMSELVNLAKEMNPDIPFEAETFEQLKGKYIFDDQKDSKEEKESKEESNTLSGTLHSELFSEYLDTLESDSFEKKDDTIKRKFTKKDIQGFVTYAKENGSKEEKQDAKDLEKNLKDLTKYEQTTTLNTKKHTQKTTIKATAKNDTTTVSFDMTLNSQAKESKKKITLPKSADTISMEEFQEIIQGAQTNESLISEEEFNELLDAIKQGGSQFNQDQIDQIKSTYKPYLTDEQYKQLEEALDQSIQTAA